MKRACLAIVDATRARIYTFQESPQELREIGDLVNPARRLRPSELFSDSRPAARSEGRMENTGHAVDDHRDAHIEHMDLEFARTIVTEIDRIVRELAFAHVIVVASPKMLGNLRKVDGVLHRADIVLDTIPRDLAKLTASQLHDHLARLELLPERQRPSSTQRA